MHMEEEPTEGFKKMNWLVGQPPFPPETFGNLLLLYCKYAYYTPFTTLLLLPLPKYIYTHV
jgi:hypothetical protein